VDLEDLVVEDEEGRLEDPFFRAIWSYFCWKLRDVQVRFWNNGYSFGWGQSGLDIRLVVAAVRYSIWSAKSPVIACMTRVLLLV